MNKRLLTTIETHFVRGAFFLALLFSAVKHVRLAQGQQPQSSKRSQTNSERSATAWHRQRRKDTVRVHDTAERPQIASPQQNYSVTRTRAPSGTICGVESRAAHGQIAPNTNGGTLDPVAFINPTTVNSSGRVAFNSQVDGSSVTRVCSLLTPPARSAQSPLAVAG